LQFERRFVLGIPVDLVTEQDVLQFVRERIEKRSPARIVTVNAEFVVRAQHDRTFRAALVDADLATPDGAGVVWALRRDGVPGVHRVGGSDLIWSLSRQAAEFGHRVFLLGGAPGVAEAAGRTLEGRYRGLLVCGSYAGSPDPDQDKVIVDLIRRSRADLLFVAFGAPAQELWIARTLGQTGVGAAMGVGGSLDYVAGTARRAPGWMQDRGLEWLWRLIRQPWRWRRMLALPRFAYLVLAGSALGRERKTRD
jgi:N-acetylglucosaminyldiphosphoundecaprenol N-acetyl-beta-D-mannosaminyltransferase